MGGAGLSAVLTRTRSPRKKGRIEMESKTEWGKRARNIIKSVELNARRELSGGESAVHHHSFTGCRSGDGSTCTNRNSQAAPQGVSASERRIKYETC